MPKRSGINGMAELERVFHQLGKVPQTVATRAARAGGAVAHKAARAKAPKDKGDLRRGLVLKRERSKVPGKAVYDVTMDPAMNDVFVKTSKDGKRSYYPASQEYGFLTVNGGYVPGYRYLKRAITEHDTEIEAKVLQATAKAVEAALRKG
jgi:hypothetical protein